ncbi:MAG: PKD domain-containing protein [Flavobacteriales bacterium]|nr:PKD domain-containing protein [Flavobacteriales bacterium]
MKRKTYLKILLFTFPLVLFTNCGKEGCTDPIAHNFDPSATKNDGKCFYGLNESSASFTINPTSNPNVVVFKADNPDVECSWDFGNGTVGSGTIDTAEYPFAGDFTVTLSIFNSQGDASSSQSISIDSNDISLFDNPLHLMLTGGISGPGYRTWHIDSACDYHFGVGPPEGSSPDWWHAPANEKPGVGLYDDRFTFHLVGFQYDLLTNGDIYVHNTIGSTFPGAFENLYDWTAPFNDMPNETWDLTTDSVLTLSNAAPMGFYTGVSEFQITQLNDTSMIVKYGHHDGTLAWFARYVPEGFVTICP